jgi:Flp pilus assembly protein TadD
VERIMRLAKTSVALLAFALLLSNAALLKGAAPATSISGRLILDNGEFNCNQCMLTLLAGGVRPVATVVLQSSGTFTFNNVPPGPYTIHADIDGFEPINQEIDATDFRFGANVTISLVRKRAPQSGRAAVVNLSEFRELYPKKAVSWFEKGTDALKDKKYGDAIKYLRNAVELAPTFYEAHNQLGIAYVESGRNDDAEREFIKAHDLNSTAVEPLLNLTRIYLDENDPARAVTAGEQAVKANSRSAPAFLNLGMALYKAAMLDRAETALRRALELAPKMANARLLLANVYLKLQRYDSSLEQLDKYIAENPKGSQLAAVHQLRDQLLKAKEVGTP